ncbi:hypothetical protein QFZ52_002164 [Arthrobacter woluwensis]|uniref:hypothetical protein n=1 Tax=Arthrobacter woluwensis TaxID=156980 RepID=UPI00278B6E56|nr:hypothetical protein [Arthrobacter woluwensis]MDQ0709512.1 hypothetical protein [Arthrobacter woluwensis]
MSLLDDPFDYSETKDGKILIRRSGRLVVTVAGGRAQDLAARLARSDEDARQQLLARATGNYRRGNEKGGRG